MTNLSDIIASSNVLTTDNTKTVTNKSIDASQLTGTYPALNGSNITNLTSGNLTGALPAIDGSNLTGISAGLDSAAVSAIIVADVDNPFVDALNVDADTLDGITSTSFLRSNTFDNVSGTLEFQDNVQLRFGGSADTIIEHDTALSPDGTRFYANLTTGGMLFQDGSTTCFDVAYTAADTTTFFQNVDFSSATVTGLSTGGGGSGSGIEGGVFLEYEKTVDSDYTIDSDGNGRGIFVLSAADDSDGLTIATGATVTVNSGSSWVLTGGDKNMGLDAMVATSNQTERTMRTGTIKPTLDSAYDLGDSAVGWNNIYVNTINPHGSDVGIGTTSPNRGSHDIALAVSNTGSAARAAIEIEGNSSNANGTLTFLNNGTSAASIDNRGAGTLTFNVGSSLTERMRINSSGNVGIGVTPTGSWNLQVASSSGSSRVRMQNSTTGTADGDGGSVAMEGNDFVLQNSENGNVKVEINGSERVRIDTNGNLGVGVTSMSGSNRLYSIGSYNATTGNGANVVIGSNGLLERSVSSQRYKNTINDATHGLTELMTLRPVTYKHNSNGDMIFGGLIAEEVHTAGLTEFVVYSQDDNGDDQPEALQYGNMVSLCIKAIQELKTELDAEKVKTATLETENSTQATQIADLITRVTTLENT